jgi:hypothetical protein
VVIKFFFKKKKKKKKIFMAKKNKKLTRKSNFFKIKNFFFLFDENLKADFGSVEPGFGLFDGDLS